MKKILFWLLTICCLGQAFGQVFGNGHLVNDQTATVSGQNVYFPDAVGSLTTSFEYSIVGTAPATLSITVQGCGILICSSTLDTYAVVAGTIRQVTATTGPYRTWLVVPTWTGGNATTKVRISQVGVMARQGGGGGGSGTVTSFSSADLAPLFTQNVATPTTTPALTFTLSNAGANSVFGNNTGSPLAPSYGSLVTAQAGANILGNGSLFQATVPGSPVAGNIPKYDASGNILDSGNPPCTLTSPIVGQVCGVTGVSPNVISNTWVGNPLTALVATSNTFLSTYREGWITNNNASATTDTIPQAGSAGFDQNYGFFGRNRGAGKVTYSATTSSIVGETILPQNAFIAAFSDPASTGVWYLSMWPTYGAYPDCPDSAGKHLNIDAVTTFAITCGTSSSSGPPNFVDNQQAGGYTVLAADFTNCKSIPVTATGTVTLLATAPANGQCILVNNIGTALAVVTVGHNTRNINGVAADVTLFSGQSTLIVSDGTNYKSYLHTTPAAVTSTTAVTASNPTAATDTKLIEISLPAGYFNGAGSTFQYDAGGTLTTTAASVPQVTFTAKLCTVTACGSGTIVSLAAIQSTALNTTAVTNAGWTYNLVLVNNATGATGNIVAKGKPGLTIELGSATTAADSVFTDSNNATSANIDLTAALFLDLFVQQSTTGASNSYKQMYASLAPPSGGNGGGGGGGSTALSSITAATAANTTANGNNPQTFNFAQTVDSQAGITFGETSAATGGTLNNQYNVKVSGAAGSTAVPLGVVGSINGSQTLPALHVNCTWNTTGVVDACLLVNVGTNSASGASSLILDLQLVGVSEFKLDKSGLITTPTGGGITTGQVNGTNFRGSSFTQATNYIMGADSSSTGSNTAANTSVRGPDETGATGIQNLGTQTFRGGDVTSNNASSVAGSVTVRTGRALSGAATGPNNGTLNIIQTFVKGATVTNALAACFSADNTVAECASNSTNAVGIAVATNTNAVDVATNGVVTVNFPSASPSAGWFACTGTLNTGTNNIVVQSTACTAGQQIGYVVKGGTTITSTTVLLRFK